MLIKAYKYKFKMLQAYIFNYFINTLNYILGTNWKNKSINYFNPNKISNDYTRHGEYEGGNARNAYVLKTDAIVEETGIIVSNSNPWLSYSPDGVIMENDVPTKLLEIKCPYSGINN